MSEITVRLGSHEPAGDIEFRLEDGIGDDLERMRKAGPLNAILADLVEGKSEDRTGCWCATGYGDDRHDADCPSLDAAWPEAEAARPEGWNLFLALENGEYRATAEADDAEEAFQGAVLKAGGPTPAAALRALVVKLRGR